MTMNDSENELAEFSSEQQAFIREARKVLKENEMYLLILQATGRCLADEHSTERKPS